MSTGFDLAQTFYVDPDAVQGADHVFITGIDLYVAAKPTQGKTKSGISSPGMSITICDTFEDGSPNIDNVGPYDARLEYSGITADTLGATATTFTFRHPVRVNTKSVKAFLVKFDGSDPDFRIWYNKAGDNVFGTTTKTQVNSGKVDGYMFAMSNGKSLTPSHDADLTFRIRVAKFTSASTSFKLKNRPYEILKASITGMFIGGEDVYQSRAALTGTVKITSGSTTLTGTGTSFSFSAGDKVVITDGTTGNTDVRTVMSVANTTSLIVDVSPSFSNTVGTYYKSVTGTMFYADPVSDHIFIQDSTANSSVYLTTSTSVYGVDSGAQALISSIVEYTVNSVVPNFAVATPPGTTAMSTINFVNTSNSMISTNAVDIPLGQRKMINQYAGKFSSHTSEVIAGTPFTSFNGSLTFTTANPYTSPEVFENDLDMFVERYDINNISTGEAVGRGQSLARYVSKPVVLTADQKAEDLKVFVRAFKPQGATLLAYAKFRNSDDPETTDSKNWTLLTDMSTGSVYSNPNNINDVVDIEYDVPLYGAGTTATGTFTTTSSNAVIAGTSGTVNTNIAVGNLVRVYSPLLSNTYFLDTVIASNTTTFTVSTAVSNASLTATGLQVDVITNTTDAFIDNQRSNVLTYFNNSYAKFQTYDSFVVKVVLLSSDNVNIPYIDDVRAIAVSA